MISSGKYYELYPADTVEIDTTKIFIKFITEYEETGTQKINDDGYDLKRKTTSGNYVFFIPKRNKFIESINRLASLAEIDNFKFNHIGVGQSYVLTEPEDNQTMTDLWHLKRTQICFQDEETPYAWQLSTGDPNIIIAVLDDGLYLNQDFDPGLPGYDYYENNNDYAPNIYHTSHGTQMATIIAAKTSNQFGLYGIAGGDGQGSKPVTIMVQRVASKTFAGSFDFDEESVAYAIEEATDKGARVINFAWGYFDLDYYENPNYPAIDLALDYAVLNDVTIIAAAGNEGNPLDSMHVSWPAIREDVISIAAMNEYDGRVAGSNKGPENDFCLPGDRIELSALPLGWANSPGGGTSVSCAMATGIVSLMLSVNPCLTRDEIKNILIESCEKVGTYPYQETFPYTPATSHNNEFGYGMINAYTAVSLAIPHDNIVVTSGNTKLIDYDLAVSGDITVENNAVLTISNCNLSMYPDTKIIVKPGGKLYVTSASLKSMCKKPWTGIEVWGNKNQHQFINANGLYYQGYVKLEKATIENAIEAVNLWNPNDLTTTGGIIYAEDSKFINNRESVHALCYRNFNPTTGKEMSYNAMFTNCEFTINTDFVHEYLEFFKHIDLNLVNGVRFYGCDFTLMPEVEGVNQFNQAIASYGSGLQVNAICKTPSQTECTDYDLSTFTGFKNAIFANNPEGNMYTLYVNRALFNNNHVGIYALKLMSPIVINSDFHIAQNKYSDETCSYGIYFNGVTSFSVEENDFSKEQGAPDGDYFGIGIIESSSVSQIYKNTFNGLTAGNYAYGHNWVIDPTKGLEYLCNQNSNNYADFYVTGIPDDLSQGVQNYQGNKTVPAGNTFSTNATTHFYNGTPYTIGYNYCVTCPNEEPQIYTHISTHQVTSANPCLSHYGGTGNTDIVLSEQEKLDLELQYAIADQNLNDVTALFNQLKDGGSTVSEVDIINQTSNDEMLQTRAKLLGDSPHLSQDVLKLVADRTNIFPDAVIFDILAANPDELRDAKLLLYLEQKENPLPEYMIDILKEVSLGTTYKTTLKQEMTRYHFEKVRAAEDIIRSIINEPELDLVQLRNWLDNLGEIEYDKQIIASYVQENDYPSAIALAETLPQLYNLQGTELTEHESYMELLNLQNTLFTENRSLAELTQEELSLIEDLSVSSTGSAGLQSMSILEAYYDKHFENCKTLLGELPFKSHSIDQIKLGDAYGFKVSVQPNPANDWISIEYTLPKEETSAEVTILSTTGSIVQKAILEGNVGQKILDLSNLKAGSYGYQVKTRSFVKTGKFIVVK